MPLIFLLFFKDFLIFHWSTKLLLFRIEYVAAIIYIFWPFLCIWKDWMEFVVSSLSFHVSTLCDVSWEEKHKSLLNSSRKTESHLYWSPPTIEKYTNLRSAQSGRMYFYSNGSELGISKIRPCNPYRLCFVDNMKSFEKLLEWDLHLPFEQCFS